MSIGAIPPTSPVGLPTGVTPSTASSAADVASTESSDFVALLERAHRTEDHAESLAAQFAAGDENVGIHEVMIAAEEANVMVRVVGTLKTRALEAYRELMNTPL